MLDGVAQLVISPAQPGKFVPRKRVAVGCRDLSGPESVPGPDGITKSVLGVLEALLDDVDVPGAVQPPGSNHARMAGIVIR
jgi:hypothetical protein